MNYCEMLNDGLKSSGLNLREVVTLIEAQTKVKINYSYLSKLRFGNKPPASDKVNDAIASVLNIDQISFKTAAYLEKIPPDVLERLKSRA